VEAGEQEEEKKRTQRLVPRKLNHFLIVFWARAGRESEKEKKGEYLSTTA
jgi:hypothetical protein